MTILATGRSTRYIYGLMVEGVGDDNTPVGGAIFCMGNAPAAASLNVGNAKNYEWVPGLIDPPDNVGVELDEVTGQLTAESLRFGLANSARVATLLTVYQTESNYVMGASLAASTTVTITGPTSLPTGFTVWAGDEAMRITGISGSDYTVDRAIFRTTAADQEDNFAYLTRTPYLSPRAVWLVRYDVVADTLTDVETGYLEDVRLEDDGTRITVIAPSATSLLARATINRDSPTRRERWTVRQARFQQNNIGPLIQRVGNAEFDRIGTTSSDPIWIQAGDALASGYRGATSASRVTFESGSGSITPKFTGAPEFEPDDEEQQTVDLEEQQIFLVHPTRINSSTRQLGSNADRAIVDVWKNPLAVSLGLLRSGSDELGDYNAWQGTWGFGMPTKFIDIADWRTKFREAREAVMDQLVLGWDGEDVSLPDLIVDVLLRPYGAYLAPRNDGRLSIGRIQLATIEDFAGASTLDIFEERLGIDSSVQKAYSAVRLEIGELPWQDPDIVTTKARDGSGNDSTRRAIFSEFRQLEFDYRTKKAGTDLTAESIALIVAGLETVPRIRVQVLPSEVTGVDYHLLDWVKINPPDMSDDWLVDPVTFERIKLSAANAAHIGLIVGRRPLMDPPSTELTLLLKNFRAGQSVRVLAPTGIVSSFDGTNTITLEANAFHDSDTDVERFTVGDIVQVCEADFALVTGQQGIEITAIGTNTITVTGLVASPTAGQVIRLDEVTNYGSGGDPFGISGRNFTYIADTDTGLVDTDEADLYG